MKKKTTEEQIPLGGSEEGEILARLGERVDRAVKMIQELRRERDELKSRLAEAEGSSSRITELEEERGEIRTRIEGILSSLEALEE